MSWVKSNGINKHKDDKRNESITIEKTLNNMEVTTNEEIVWFIEMQVLRDIVLLKWLLTHFNICTISD